MSDLVAALGLLLVIEGLTFAAFPGSARRALEAIAETPETTLRILGFAAALFGLLLVWFVRR
jgi:uncharacterized protein YjeT (DUF2065 family)